EGQARQTENRTDETPELALVAGVLDEHRHEGGRIDRADQQVVQDVGQGAGDDVRVGVGRGAEDVGDGGVAQEAESTTEDVAEGDDRRGAKELRMPHLWALERGCGVWRGLLLSRLD